LQKHGYRGYLCADAILSVDYSMLFTEMNVRPGAETHAYVLANHLFGRDYAKTMTIITGNKTHLSSFDDTIKKLQEENMLLTRGTDTGVVILTIDHIHAHKIEYFIAAKDEWQAQAFEQRFHLLFDSRDTALLPAFKHA
jgi:hypothetical protein